MRGTPVLATGDTPLFTVADLRVLGTASVGLGSRVRLAGGSVGVVVAEQPARGASEARWWVVKIGRSFVNASDSAFEVLS